MDLGIPTCAEVGCPDKSKLQPLASTTYLQVRNTNYKNQQLPILSQNEPYMYLGVELAPFLTWTIRKTTTNQKVFLKKVLNYYFPLHPYNNKKPNSNYGHLSRHRI